MPGHYRDMTQSRSCFLVMATVSRELFIGGLLVLIYNAVLKGVM